MHAIATGEWEGDIFFAAEVFVHSGGPPPPPPGDTVQGQIIDIDPDAQTLTLASHWENDPNQVIVQVTDDTMIYGDNGEPMEFSDIQLQDFAFCIGEFQQEIFYASEIYIERNPGPPPPGDTVQGQIIDIDPDAYILFIGRCQGETAPVQVTEETVLMDENGPIAFGDIEIGMHAIAAGEWTGDIFTATEVFVHSGW